MSPTSDVACIKTSYPDASCIRAIGIPEAIFQSTAAALRDGMSYVDMTVACWSFMFRSVYRANAPLLPLLFHDIRAHAGYSCLVEVLARYPFVFMRKTFGAYANALSAGKNGSRKQSPPMPDADQ